MTNDMAFWPATRLLAEIQKGVVGVQEALEHFWARVEKYNPPLNAIVAYDIDAARQRARNADAALQKGETWGPLHGLPMTIKDAFNLVGLPTTWGLPEHRDNYPESNALVVDRLLAAGAIIFGKTNVPRYLADWETFNEIYGTTNNPWNLEHSPGGSSGGSAAALAAGLCALEMGSDIGASIRNPAHYCGVFGHKPTYGIVTTRGHALPGKVSFTDISVVGPLARSARDLDLGLRIMGGPDEIDSQGWRLTLPPPRKTEWHDFRIAIKLDDPAAEVDQSVQDCIQSLAEFAARQGAQVSDRARPEIDTANADALYITLVRAATSSRQSDEEFRLNKKQAQEFSPDDQSYHARMARGNTLSHRDWLAANELRHRMRLEWAKFFENYDLLLCPAASTTAMKHDQKGERYERRIPVNGHFVPPTDQMFWAGYSGMAYLPSTVAPIGFNAEKLPIGVQIIGPQYCDRTCIQFAELIERDYQAFEPPPAFDLSAAQ